MRSYLIYIGFSLIHRAFFNQGITFFASEFWDQWKPGILFQLSDGSKENSFRDWCISYFPNKSDSLFLVKRLSRGGERNLWGSYENAFTCKGYYESRVFGCQVKRTLIREKGGQGSFKSREWQQLQVNYE